MHLWSRFGNPNFNRWWVMVWRSSKWVQFWVWSYIWPWRSRSITPQNNRDLNQGVLHFWFKFGDSNLNEWQVIARTSPWLTPTRTDAGNDNTRRPKLASGKNDVIFWHLAFGMAYDHGNVLLIEADRNLMLAEETSFVKRLNVVSAVILLP